MKVLISLMSLLCLWQINAQENCSNFYPKEQGTKLVIENFNRKNKLTSTVQYTLTQVEQNTDKTVMSISMQLKDGRNNELVPDSSFKAVCENGSTYLDPESFLSPSLFKQYQGMEYSIEGSDISFPNELEVGQSLEDCEIIMSVDSGIMNITTKVEMIDRKVVAKENVTTPAGTFDCYLIEYKNTTTMNMGINQTMFSKQWIAKGIGMVKQEFRKQNGKLISKSVLASVK